MTIGKEDPGIDYNPAKHDGSRYEDMDDYNLCALYCDYHEWLTSPMTAPRNPATRAKYLGKLHEIIMTIARRYKDEV